MKRISVKLLGNLIDFIGSDDKSSSTITVQFKLSPSLKDILEAQGIPHTAVFKVLVNNQPAQLSRQVDNGDKVVAYSIKEIDTTDLNPIYITPSSFICDDHLGKLGRTLRLLGFDTIISSANLDNAKLIQLSNDNQRMILTRDRALLKRSEARFGYWVRSTDPEEQIIEIFERFELGGKIHPFSRCLECNGILDSVSLNDVADKVPPKVQQWHDQFFQCRQCKKVYWKGSHYKQLEQKVARLKEISQSRTN